jgi:hypothetical protein
MKKSSKPMFGNKGSTKPSGKGKPMGIKPSGGHKSR